MRKKIYNILLVEDDQALGYVLTEYLKIHDFDVKWANSGKNAMAMLDANSFDLVILDVTLPDQDGFVVSEQLRMRHPNLPFLFLTARSMKIDVLKGFSKGAVDYIKKPIDEDELVARIKAITSRVSPSSEPEKVDETYKIGDFLFNNRQQLLIHPEERVSLTSRETELLYYLATHKNQLCSHKDILLDIWGESDYFNKKSLNVFISHLRKYLARDSSVTIENIHNRGYILKY